MLGHGCAELRLSSRMGSGESQPGVVEVVITSKPLGANIGAGGRAYTERPLLVKYFRNP